MKTITKHFAGILLALLCAHAQGAMAQGTAMTEDALRSLVKMDNHRVKLGTDITLTNGRLDIDGLTISLDLNGHTLTRPMTAADQNGQVIAVMNGGQLTIKDSSGNDSGTITGGWAKMGGGILVSTGCELTIEGGTITGNTAAELGGGIHNEGTTTIKGGTITGNTAGTYGGAIYSNSTVSVSGITLSSNTAQTGGGAICTEGTLTLDGVTIQGNSAQYGGGVYMFKSASTSPGIVQLKGVCTITGNTASYGIDVYQNKDATLNIQDRPVVDDLYLTEYSFITLTGALTTGASIGLNAEKVDQTHLTLHYPDYHAGTNPQTFFTSKNAAYAIGLRPDGVDGANEVAYGISYMERGWDTTEKRVTEEEKTCTSYTAISGTDTSDEGWVPLYDGWYVVTGNSIYKALSVVGTDVHLILPDGVTLYVNHVKLESGHKLSIYSQSNNAGTLDAINDEISNAAGIGGGEEACAGTIIIHGGIVQAKGDGNAAGIGGGYKGGFAKEAVNGGLTVYGGQVTATGDKRGAGIGSGSECENFAGYVTIYGGSVNATGGGQRTATESYCGAGIGGGDVSSGAITHIYGGIVNATGGRYDETYSPCGAGIGGGYVGSGVMTHIHGGNVTAISGYGAGIGSGSDLYGGGSRGVYGGEVIIDGGTINASSTDGGAIGGSYEGLSATITINGGTVTAKSTRYGVGIGCGRKGESATITINGGNVTATCTGIGAGIGCGMDGKSATITINGGNITASGDNDYGAGIGGGYDANPKLDITITGGTVSASGYNGIGSTRYEDYLENIQDSDYDGTLTITGGKIYATGEARAIGGKNVTSLMTLYDGAMVKAGDTADGAVLFPAGERVQACVYRKYAAIEQCTHTGSVITIDDGLTHHTSCTYCQVGADGQAEGHVFAQDGKCVCGLYSLKDDADNGEVISALTADQNPHPVTLTGRTLYKDGAWNTLCLPFALSDSDPDDNLTFTGTPLEGATVKTLSSTAFDSQTGTLTLNFSDAPLTAIEAGRPYLVKWAAGDAHIENPVFSGVTIVNTTSDVVTNELAFRGIYAPLAISGEDRSLLYLDADNTLCYPSGAMQIDAFRAYFELADGITAGDPASGIRTFVLNFDGEETGIREINASNPSNPSNFSNASNLWFTLDGRRLDKPSSPGLYIHNGRKVLIK